MWIEVNNKVIVGVHSEQTSTQNTTIFLDDADITVLGKWYTKQKGIHDPILTKAQQIEADKDKQISEAIDYLNKTDYVITKISEAIVLNNDELRKSLIEQYSEILTKRNEYRTSLG